MKRVNDETDRLGRVLGNTCFGVVIGLSLLGPTRVSAQALDTAKTTGAVAPSEVDSGVCATLDRVMTKAMQAPKVQALMQSAAMEALQSGKTDFEVSLDAINMPDSLRAPLVSAVTRGAFDSARAIGKKFISADDKLTTMQFALMMEVFETSPEEFRPLIIKMFDNPIQLAVCGASSPAVLPPSEP